MSTKPKTVGRYRRLEKIGYGNFGVVYKGQDLKTNRVVAIKTLDLDAVNDDVESVQLEVALLAHLSQKESSNVTKYFGTVLEGSKLWIIMDLCSGGSVRTLLRAGPLEDKYLGVIFREITVAVKAIHAEGIIHRDLKAANVLITMSGQLKLCDFGVAAHSQLGVQAKRMTIVGTPYWMAPEVISEGRSYTNKADIWSLGITFYEIVTGNPPYSEHEAMRALMLITNSRPPRLEGPKYAPSLKDLVALCLDEDPEARPSADTVLKHKFIKQYAKLGTNTLLTVVERYVNWKKKHSDHRDSLLMFNPHKDNDDETYDENEELSSENLKKEQVANVDFTDDDADSVWNFGDNDDTITATEPDDDLGNAPDSLRELFGVAPRQEHEYSWPIIRTRADSIKDQQSTHTHTAQHVQSPQLTQGNSSPHSSPFLATPELGPQLRSTASQSQTHLNNTKPSSHFVFPPAPISNISNSNNIGNIINAQNTAQTTAFPEKVSVNRAPTAVSISRSRSTTVSASPSVPPVNWVGWRSRHESELHLDQQSEIRNRVAPLDAEISSIDSDPEIVRNGISRHSSISESVKTIPPMISQSHPGTVQPTASNPLMPQTLGEQSPKDLPQIASAVERSVIPPLKQRVTLPRLQMPSRGAIKSPSLMSAPIPSGPKAINQPAIPRNKRAANWASQFPPMPQLDSNALLDSAPDELVVDTLLELVIGYKSAISSLAGQLEA